jgi:Phytanoyl-CoA dioxygenase (PhyH)/SCP-2 sterol transfer family
MGVDVRTRVDSGDDHVANVGELFASRLPAALADASSRLQPALRDLPLRTLVVDVEGERWTLAVEGDAVVVAPGAGADPQVTLKLMPEQVRDLVDDQVTPIGWLASGALDLDGGRLADILNWWLVLRAALDGTTPHRPGDVALTGDDGRPLDLGRTFRPDDPPEEMADFLERAGYLHLGGLFEPDEMAAVSDDMDRVAPTYEPGDGRSWWATLADGSESLVRMQGFDRESPVVADLLTDDRLLGLDALSRDGHQWGRRTSNRIEALFKPLGVVQGISDIPWHKDCSLGRHSYDCCAMTVGISVTGADDTSGQLRVVAGSHRALVWPGPVVQPGLDLPVVDLPTEVGDITIHLSCTMHMAQPPVDRPRRVLYTSLSLPSLAPAAAALARQRLGAIRESAPVTVSQPAASAG